MGDETWASIQMVKNTRDSIRDRIKRRKVQRDTILSVGGGGSGGSGESSPSATRFKQHAGELNC